MIFEFSLPFPKLPDFSIVLLCLSDAIAISVVILAIHISMAKMFSERMNYKIDPNQEVFVNYGDFINNFHFNFQI